MTVSHATTLGGVRQRVCIRSARYQMFVWLRRGMHTQCSTALCFARHSALMCIMCACSRPSQVRESHIKEHLALAVHSVSRSRRESRSGVALGGCPCGCLIRSRQSRRPVHPGLRPYGVSGVRRFGAPTDSKDNACPRPQANGAERLDPQNPAHPSRSMRRQILNQRVPR